MKKGYFSLAAYTAGHFAVDLGCGWLIMAMLGSNGPTATHGAAMVLLYNILAFGLQFIIGGAVDSARERGRMLHPATALLGCLGVVAALLIGTRSPWFAVVLVGVGNAAFHVGGGVDALLYANGKMGRCGVFVSSGAVGVALGLLCGGLMGSKTYIPALAVAVSGVLIALFGKCREVAVPPAEYDGATPVCVGALGLVLCLFAVLVRSYAGFLFHMPWKQGLLLVMAAAAAAAVGKATGGLLADRFGGRWVGAVSVALSVPLVILGRGSVVLSLLGLVCFNIAMPITLHTAAARLPRREGFAFGLTTLALLVGFLLSGITLPRLTADIVVAATGLLAAVAVGLSSPGRRADK